MDHSPSPSSMKPGVKTMSFPEAAKMIITGKRVTKLEWANPGIFVFLEGGWLKIKKEDGIICKLLLNEGDMTGVDWVVLDQ